MQPKRKQGPGQVRRPQKPVSPVFKTGDYVPLAILIVEGDKLKNHHLPQKLFAVKDFVQADVMLEYFFQHPQQPLMLDPNRPRPAEFNAAVCNFSNWMVERGYCTREDGTSDLKIHIWTEEEMETHRAELKAHREAQVLAHAEYMAARAAEGGDEGMEISQGINNLLGASNAIIDESKKMYGEFEEAALEQDRPAINVGTVGHVDHGMDGVSRAMAAAVEVADTMAAVRTAITPDPVDVAELAGVAIEIDPTDPDPASTRAFIAQEVVSQRSLTPDPVAYERQAGASADLPEAYMAQERPAHRYDELLMGKPEGYADLPQPVINHEVGGQIGYAPAEEVRTPQYPRIHERDPDMGVISESGTHYPELSGKSREELDAHFGDRAVSDAELLAADPKGGL